MATVESFCRFCPTACGVTVTLSPDTVPAVKGDREHPVTKGYTCPKGRALGEWHTDPRRLDQMQVRGVPMPAEAGLDDLAQVLSRIRAESDPASIAIFRGSGASFDSAGLFSLQRLKTALQTPSYYSTLTIDCASLPLVAGLIAGNPGLHLGIPSRDARLVVLFGANPMVSHGHSFFIPAPANHLRNWTSNGELWVVDPRRTESAKLATRHLAARPGSDYALAAYLVRELLIDGADREYLDAWTEGAGELSDAVRPFELARVAALTQLPEQDILDLLAAIRRNGQVACSAGTGVTMSPSANLTVWLVWVLNIITRAIDHPGGTWFNPGAVRQLDQRPWPPHFEARTELGPRSRPELGSYRGEYPSAALADEIDSGNVRALIVLGSNLVTCLPDVERTRRSLQRLEALVVLNVVETDTTRLATHVIPCAGQLERADLLLNDWLKSDSVWQFTRAVMPPSAGRRPSWWWLAKLGTKLGLRLLPGELDPDRCTDEDVLRVVATAGGQGFWSGDLSDREDVAAMQARAASFEAVAASPGGLVTGRGERFGWVHEALRGVGRKWRLAPPELVDQLGATPDEQLSALRLVPARQLRHMNSQFPAQQARPHEADGPELVVHPDDAAAAGVLTGGQVLVESPHGRLLASVRVDDRIRPGSVSIPHGYGGHNVNQLTSTTAGVDELSGMAMLAGIPVTITAVEPGPARPST